MDVLIDSDGNPATGSNKACNEVQAFEYLSDAGSDQNRLNDGNYAILGTAGAPTTEGVSEPSAEAVTTVNGRMLSQTFYLPTVGVFDGGAAPRIGIAVRALNGGQTNYTDCVPSRDVTEFYTTSA